ncbi:hypothetical protein [Klebsiella sp. WP8-S18-ESBL-06]|uniref:hypothetical protein n=1 Tax=Klebsiella sp. WP8-S18-ESBL-06 TaxID=2675726 RepID=UPI0016002CC0|nr:hypothetical protein [Klebsiella sp. WP8-S18-ESBL-06]
MTNKQLTDGVIDVWFNAAKAAIHHPATPRNEHSHAFAAYTLAQEVRKLRAELQEHRKAAIPAGWKLVPIEPTEGMIVDGLESEPDEFFSDAKIWAEYEAMSGCQQAAHRAKLCWAAMLSAAPTAPEQENI